MKDSDKPPKRPIDIKRDSAGSFSIDEPDAKIEEMLVVDDAMIIVSTKSVHQSQLADQIDPNRINIHLPKVIQQKIIAYGSETPFIVQTLVMARNLFDTTYLGKKFDKNGALSFALKAANEFAAAADILAAFEADQASGFEKLETAVRRGSLYLPTITSLHSRVSSYANHIRATCLNLIGIAQLFYPKAKNNDGWRKAFDTGIQGFLEQNDRFKGAAQYLCEFIERASNMRNAIEHPDKSKSAKLVDFRVDAVGAVSKPKVTISFEGTTLVDADVDAFMKFFLDKAGEAFEDMCALLCDANIVPFGPLKTWVATDQPNESIGPRRYRYHSQFNEGFEPPQTKGASE